MKTDGHPNSRQSDSCDESIAEWFVTRVLVVDDDEMIRQLLHDALTMEGYQATTVQSGEAALQVLESSAVDVIITDLSMPGMNGLELIRRTNTDHPHVPKIIITGAGTIENAIEAIRIGAYDYIRKPLNLGELWIVLNRAVKNRRLLQANQEYQRRLQESNQSLEQRVKERTEELMRSMRLKDNFLSHLSHEILTPLAPLKGYLSIMRQNLDDREMVLESLEAAGKEAVRLQNLLEGLIDLSHLVAGEADVMRIPTDLNECIGRAVTTERDAAAKKNVTLSLELDQNLPRFLADPAKIYQVIANLLTNAIKFSEEGGSVTLASSRKGDQICFQVRDSGIGIPTEEQPHVFEAFHQIDGSTRRRHGGIGIGLSLAKQLVELHRGTIELESRAGKGTIISVGIPFCQA
jgi:signal transduction histidine kinase